MKAKIEKLIAEYESKVVDCDAALGPIREEIRSYRNDKTKEIDLWLARIEGCRQLARRQAYVQFIADLESLLD